MAHTSYGLNELREMFLKFFETKGHLRLPSFSLVPQHDKSVLLINAGMTPMKTWFTNEEEPPRRRVCTCQKCIRTPDIENIGKTDRHGTYFEMLGNFSFGDYFKREAIHWSWEFLTSPEWVGLEPDRLYPSVYQDDDEAWNIWHDEIGIAEENIFRFGKEDNFWEHGSGPCGPCSEIYYDRGPEHGCGKPTCTVGCDCDRYIEVWNNVFTQFNNDGKGNYTELTQKNIDTGMGLERLACVSQNVGSLFDVDTVRNITSRVSELTGAAYHEDPKKDVSLRIITDHIRASTMMISDGILPSNEGRGYVLRRLLRRASRHARLLGVQDPMLHEVVATVIHENKTAYPELVERQEFITRVVQNEENTFARTIDEGERIFKELLQATKDRGEETFSGEDAFRLYDTYGFPLDLTADMSQEAGMQVDRKRFDELMVQQRQQAREARKALGDLAWAGVDLGLDNTPTVFTGYDREKDEAEILALVGESECVYELGPGESGSVVLDRTPMYAEMGGQTADHGLLRTDGGTFEVTDVQKNKAGKFLHRGRVLEGRLRTGEKAEVRVDGDRRRALMRAHSATHLLQAALREILGRHVTQAGSMVQEDRLRFDFTHFEPMTREEIAEVMQLVNDKILEDLPVTTRVMDLEAAQKEGAMALFGEKYGDRVRVVSMGDFSEELCGGTHVANTAKIGPFHIVSESSVASGVRRVEAVCGRVCIQEGEKQALRSTEVARMLKTTPGELVERSRNLVDEIHGLRQNLGRLKDRLLSNDAERVLFAAKTVGGLKIITITRTDLSAEELRREGDLLRDRDPNTVAVLATKNGDKVQFVAVCGKNAVARGIRAGDLVRSVSAVAGGKGGGRPDSAMGGGTEVLKIDDALASVDDFVAGKLKEEEIG